MAEVESGKLNICHHGLGNCTRKMIANLTTPELRVHRDVRVFVNQVPDDGQLLV